VKNRSGKYIKFVIYLAVIVLLNIVGLTLSFRGDLTENKVYSISEVSRQVVASLTEPLTINVFFSENLPAPHNNTERYLRDLLEEYALHANRFFNYRFYNVNPESDGLTASGPQNQALAGNYGINPVQIQHFDKDEVKFKRAYMGLVIIHGDIVERIPTITSTEGLEYKLTTAIQKVNNKISSLLALTDKIRIDLYLSASLKVVAPFMGLEDLPKIPEKLEEIVEKLNQKNYDRLAYTHIDPATEAEQTALAEKHQIMVLKWPALDNGKIPAGNGVIGIVMSHQDKTITLPLLNVFRVPIIGTQYQLAGIDELEQMLNAQVESLVDINVNLGYLADHGALPLGAIMPMGRRHPDSLKTFSALINQTYSPKNFMLTEEGIPEDVNCIVLARPTQPFTDYELFQIDQALMRGQNLAIFLEPFKEVRTQAPNPMGFQAPRVTYESIDTGLEKLLAHYGVNVKKSILMDENCFKQQMGNQFGGGEQSVYFAPLIKSENINHDLAFMRNIKGLIALKASPLSIDEKKLTDNNLTATRLFSSSERSWEMKPPINLDLRFLRPPTADEEMDSEPLAYLIEGAFPSYFAGKPIPEKVDPNKADQDDADSAEATADAKESVNPELAKIAGTQRLIEKGAPARIFLIGTGEMLRDDLIDPEGRSPNAQFVMNLMDMMNGREGIAVMRSKAQRFNPLADTRASTKTIVKAFNIVGLPVLVVLFGLFVWMRRHSRKRVIQAVFKTR